MFGWLADDIQIEQILWARSVSTAGVLVFVALALGWSIYIYRRRTGAPTWVRAVLGSSRLLVLCLIAAILFEPTATISQPRTVKRRLPVLIDASESMSIRDQRKRPADIADAAGALGFLSLATTRNPSQALMALNTKQRQSIANASRLDLAKGLLAQSAHQVFDPLAEELDISYHAFGDTLQLLSDDQVGASVPLAVLQPEQAGTAIADSLEAIANSERSAPLTGVVLISDGLDTAARPAVTAAIELGRQGIPIYTIPMGIVDPGDVSIRSVVMQEVAFTGDKVPVRVQIHSKGYEKRSVDITVTLNGRSAALRNVTLLGGLQFEDVFFTADVQEKGAAQVDVELTPFGDEATAANNRVERSIRVVNEKVNVLCIEGSARWEYRYLRAMLKRDRRIDATFIASRGKPEMAQNSSEYLARFPSLREDAFQYDLVILGDVDAEFFSLEEMALLVELVKNRGGSLLMLCGARYAPSSYANTTVAQMLPVTFDAKEKWEYVDASVHPVMTPEGRSSLVLTLEHEQELNDRIWSQVAPMDRIPPLAAAKPGATVLAELSDASSRAGRYPLVAWQRYGAGKCMTIATDRLWLLRFKTGDKYHWRAWSQCIQFLTLSRLMGEHKRIRLETDRASYGSSEQVQLYANLLDDNYDPVSQPGFDVIVSELDDLEREPQRVTLRPDRSTPGLYEGYFSPARPGRYRLEANADDSSLASTTEFQVADVNLEMANAEMQIKRLRRISELSGGETLSVGDLQSLPAMLNRAPHTTTIRSDHSLWDNGWIGFLLILLMGSEWIVRRRYDLS